MNLLNPENVSDKKYVIDMMNRNSFSTITPEKSIRKFVKKIAKKKVVFSFVLSIVAISLPLTMITTGNVQFVAKADNLNYSDNPSVLGAQSVINSIPLQPLDKKNVVPSFEVGDKRALALKKYLDSKNSPLAIAATDIVAAADKYHIDYTLIPAISGVESGFCKVTTLDVSNPNKETHNCWGWGKRGNSFWEFASWAEGVNKVSKGIYEVYGSNPTPEEMQDIYCTSCIGLNDWKTTVRDYMNDIKSLTNSL